MDGQMENNDGWTDSWIMMDGQMEDNDGWTDGE